ncbi:MAG: hypothetical protein AAGH15_06315 [Myxococcota bacterium]
MLWAGAIELPAPGPLDGTEWLALEAGETECSVTSRCTQTRFPLVVQGGDLVLQASPGEAVDGMLTEGTPGGQLQARVYRSGNACGPADGALRPVVEAVLWQSFRRGRERL